MIKVTYGNIKDDSSPWYSENHSFKMNQNLTAATILMSMIDGLKEGDYVIIQKPHEN